MVTVWSHFAIEGSGDGIGGGLIILRRDVLVDPHRDRYVGVTESLRDHSRDGASGSLSHSSGIHWLVVPSPQVAASRFRPDTFQLIRVASVGGDLSLTKNKRARPQHVISRTALEITKVLTDPIIRNRKRIALSVLQVR